MRQALTLSALVVTLVAMAAIGVSAMVEQNRSIRPIEVAVETVAHS
jgi:hypothetical protein